MQHYPEGGPLASGAGRGRTLEQGRLPRSGEAAMTPDDNFAAFLGRVRAGDEEAARELGLEV